MGERDLSTLAANGLVVGELVHVRGREWTVETIPEASNATVPLAVDLACIDDDAQGQRLRIVLDSEIDARRLGDDLWSRIAREGTDDPEVFAAHLKAVTWRSATAADRDLFQAPFRAGIRLDPYQLLPLAKALRLPRVNLLIADDVGLGKTVEAGLVMREMLLRRRVDYVVVAAPAAMTAQWQDELAQKFGLGFTIIDREYLAAVRRAHGFTANPWAVGSRFIISHSLLGEETYSSGLKDQLDDFRPRAMFILDEAHHAAPASGTAYATDSRFTGTVRNLAERFEHRLFLSATPHNGHSNSFTSLLEILDPQRFFRGMPEITPRDLEPIMVRRLKSDLLKLNVAKFPRRDVTPIHLRGLPADTPELVLADMLEGYRAWCESGLQGAALSRTRFLMSGLQQRLLSSIPAFARTLRRHLETLKRHRNNDAIVAVHDAAVELIANAPDEMPADDASEESQLDLIQAQQDDIAAAATDAVAPLLPDFDQAISQVSAMLDIAQRNERKPDAKVKWLIEWIRQNMLDQGSTWNARRLLIFTEWEDTRLWLEKQLRAEFSETDEGDRRVATFTGITGQDRREEVKRAFNADPMHEPLRILLATDAAREGINLQTRCHDLVHFDLPWNPSRLEQRNGRIDRKLQPSEVVTCRYFVYEQRAEDRVLDALVRKTETIREQLGSAGQVLGQRIHRRLSATGISRILAAEIAREIDDEDGGVFTSRARHEMADEPDRRLARLQRELADLDRDLNRARQRVGIEPGELQSVVQTALSRDSVPLVPASDVGIAGAFRLDASRPAFAKDLSWGSLFDELREGRPPGPKRLAEWRAERPVRAISFSAPVLPDGRDAEGVVHVHLEHRLVRRLLSRFVSHGFKAGLNRASVVYGPGNQARVVLVGRLALYGPGAARLHEEIIQVTAPWSERARSETGLKAFGERGEQTTIAELEAALRGAAVPPKEIVEKLLRTAHDDVADLRAALQGRAIAAADLARAELHKIAIRESADLAALLETQRDRIRKAAETKDTPQFELDLSDQAERKQRDADRRHWQKRLEGIGKELAEEPGRLAESYEIRAQRLEPVGIVYLWPRQA